MKKILTFLTVMFLFNINVSAASLCTYKEQTELNSKAANIKVSYEAMEETIGEDDVYINNYFKISIINVTEDFYVVVKNNINKDEKTFTSSDAKDGLITFNWTNINEITNFTILVYTTNNTNCAHEKFKTIYLTTPRYNVYSDRDICYENSDFYLCQKYVTFAEIDDMEFLNKLDNYLIGETNNKGEEPTKPVEIPITDKIFNFIDDYKWFIIGGVLIIITVSYTIYRVKTKKQRELGL